MTNNGIVHSNRIAGRYYALERDEDVAIVRREVEYVDRPSGFGFGTCLVLGLVCVAIGVALSERD